MCRLIAMQSSVVIFAKSLSTNALIVFFCAATMAARMSGVRFWKSWRKDNFFDGDKIDKSMRMTSSFSHLRSLIKEAHAKTTMATLVSASAEAQIRSESSSTVASNSSGARLNFWTRSHRRWITSRSDRIFCERSTRVTSETLAPVLIPAACNLCRHLSTLRFVASVQSADHELIEMTSSSFWECTSN